MDIFEANPDGTGLKHLTNAKGYDAEGSATRPTASTSSSAPTAPAGQPRTVHHGRRRQERPPADARPGLLQRRPVLLARRQARDLPQRPQEKDQLQLYVIDADGTNETALTENVKWVHWAPYWYKDGKHIIYTAADHSDDKKRPNYDLYWMDIATKKATRLTFAPGADVLPVFDPDCKRVMWSSTRDGRSPTQLYLADFVPPKE